MFFCRACKKLDRNFTPDNLVTFLKGEMIPIILEAGALNDVDIVEDWCLDTAAQRILMRNRIENFHTKNNRSKVGRFST